MNKYINPDKPEENLGYLLWQTTMLWQRQMNRALEGSGFTHTQFVIMAALAALLKKSNNVTQKEIAQRSNTDTMMVSKILRKLQENRFIERKEHKTDSRAKCVFITKTGLSKLDAAFEIITEANKSFFGALEDEPNFREELKRIIN